jgi:hypothetical protein
LVSSVARKLRAGMRVLLPWGLDTVEGSVLEVWGDPPKHARVAVELSESDERSETVPLLLPAYLLRQIPQVSAKKA